MDALEVLPKEWGVCRRLLDSPSARVEAISIHRGGFSSRHQHTHQANGFFLCRGAVDIIGFKPNGERVTHQLRAYGDFCIADAGEIHQFFALEDSDIIEIYLPAVVRAGDIQRQNGNGVASDEQIHEYAVEGRLPNEVEIAGDGFSMR